jgi:hypothetical protein
LNCELNFFCRGGSVAVGGGSVAVGGSSVVVHRVKATVPRSNLIFT